MKRSVFFILIFFSFQFFLFAQGLRLFYPDDSDSTSFDGQRKFMFVGEKNPIGYEDIGKIISIINDNGEVYFDAHNDDFYIIPKKIGDIHISALVERWFSSKRDTLTINQKFESISHPNIKVVIIKDDFNKNKTIHLDLYDESVNDSLDSRYTICSWGSVEAYDESSNLIGDMIFVGKTIDFADWSYFCEKEIKTGYQIRISFAIRDLKTGLIFATIDSNYKLK